MCYNSIVLAGGRRRQRRGRAAGRGRGAGRRLKLFVYNVCS